MTRTEFIAAFKEWDDDRQKMSESSDWKSSDEKAVDLLYEAAALVLLDPG